MASGYLRFPHLHRDLLTFTAADDVWLAPVTGGRAWRVSHDGAPVLTPRFSPDGDHLAWVSTRDGHPEVMVQELATGRTRRLTHWGATNTRVLGWTTEPRSGTPRILAASNAGQIDSRLTPVHAVSLDGHSEPLPYGPASGLAVHPDGPVALSTGGRPPAWWKRYRGGTAQRLWLDRTAQGDWERLLADDEAGLVDPMWLGDTLVFTSDREATLPGEPAGQANLWALNPLASRPRLRRITESDADTGYVRDAATDGRRIVWHTRGQLHLLTRLTGEPRTVEIDLPGVDPAPLPITPTDQLGDLHPDHHGDASLASWRGAAVRITHRDGPVRLLESDDAVRARAPHPLGTTGDAVWIRNGDGVDTVVRASLTDRGRPHTIARGIGRVLHLLADPQGRRVAIISHDGRIRIVDLTGARASTRTIATSPHGEAEGLAFSPDGRHLVWHQPTMGEAEHHQLMWCDLDAEDEATPLTSGRFHDTSPGFTADGAHLVFLSARTFDPSYDDHSFDLGFRSSTRPWLVPLSATEPAPFGPSVDGWRISSDEAEPAEQDEADEGTDVPESPTLDLDGFEERIVAFPVPSGTFTTLQPTADGVLWIRTPADTGKLGAARAGVPGEPPGDILETWLWTPRRVEVLVEGIDAARVSGDGKLVVCRAKDTVTVRPTDRRLEADDKDLVTVDLARLRRSVDRRAEWAQMFAENAQLMADHYWRADLDGVDWPAVTGQYAEVLDRVLTHDDLVDLMWECVGELNTSHAYVSPAPSPLGAERRLGHLGADLSRARGGWRIDRVLPGESSDPQARSPLRAAGVDARPGDLVVAVDGQGVDADLGPAALLQGAAERPVELTLRRGRQDRRVVVVPLPDEFVLRYQDWVRSRAAYVAERSGGRLGYVHVPDMQSLGWAQLHRDLARAARAEGLVVDVRYNRGGHTSQLVIERIARKVVGWAVGRHLSDWMSYPDAAPRGPVVLVANEYSGSDGDIVNAAAQALGIGPVVGTRTWGGVVGIDGRYDLVDGTSVTQPRYSHWFVNHGWGVENHGVDPDIEVVHTPADFGAEVDPQLDRAIEEVLTRLEAEPAAVPPGLPEPRAI